MSVIIQGMKMPQNCDECAINFECCACSITGTRFWDKNAQDEKFDPYQTRLKDCPLREV